MYKYPAAPVKFIIAVNVFLYLFSPVACFAHNVEMLDDASAATASSFLTLDTFESEDSDGEQDHESRTRQSGTEPGYHAASENRLTLPQIVLPILDPPELSS